MITLIAKNLYLDFETSRCHMGQSSDCGYFRTIRHWFMKMLGTLVHWCESQVEIFYGFWFYFWAEVGTPSKQAIISARKLAEVAGHGDSKCGVRGIY